MIDLPPPTAAEVATLVSTTCRSCHVAGGVAPFAFDTLGDLRREGLPAAMETHSCNNDYAHHTSGLQ